MSSATYVGSHIKRFNTSPQYSSYTKVIIAVSDGVEIVSGTDLGRTLRISNPWGTQQMADDLVESIRGFQYQPYTAEGALVEPAVELGDGVTVHNVYSGIYKITTDFSRFTLSGIAAPSEKAIEHEYPYKSRPNKEITKETRLLRASLKILDDQIQAEVAERTLQGQTLQASLDLQTTQIEAKVSKSGGDNSSFGWLLDDSSWTIESNGSTVLKASDEGLEVHGRIVATSGKLGGFDITRNAISYNSQVWGGTNTTGIYLGPEGLQLGKVFKVDANGNLTATSGTFSGYVKAGNIQYGGSSGTLSGAALTSRSVGSSQIGLGSLATANMSSGIVASLGYADYSNTVFNGVQEASYIRTRYLSLNQQMLTLVSTKVVGEDGSTKTIRYVSW